MKHYFICVDPAYSHGYELYSSTSLRHAKNACRAHHSRFRIPANQARFIIRVNHLRTREIDIVCLSKKLKSYFYKFSYYH